MASVKTLLWISVLMCIWKTKLASAYDGDTCCNMSRAAQAFIGLDNSTYAKQICGQTYGVYLAAAMPLKVPYNYCRANCSGIGLSKAYEPRQWAAPIVQFILPSVIFSMTIPRRKKISFENMFDKPVNLIGHTKWLWVNHVLQLMRSFTAFMIVMLPIVVIDTLIWIFVIVVGAAHMVVGGLHEAHLDYRIVKHLHERMTARESDGEELSEDAKATMRQLLVTVTSGNLVLEEADVPTHHVHQTGDPQRTIPASLTMALQSELTLSEHKAQSRLLNLLGAQSSFGSAVGSPVIFYLGAFVFTILDLENNKSDQDSAISLSFGMEWMIIVHVAIVSGCLLASNNPSTSSGIVGGGHEALKPRQVRVNSALVAARVAPNRVRRNRGRKVPTWSDAYPTDFQPVSLWSRGINKMMWIKKSTAWNDEDENRRERFRKAMNISIYGWIFKIFVPTIALIGIPPAAGGFVAYITPPKGVGCRSLSFIVYAISQFLLSIIAQIRNAVDDGGPGWLTGKSFRAICFVFWFLSLAAAIGGTTMQITGVYRNCICYAGAENWWGILRGTANPPIQLASDTQDARDSSTYWVSFGSFATVFMVFNCSIGWWYQRLIRRRFTEVVVALAPILPEAQPEGDGEEDPAAANNAEAPLENPDDINLAPYPDAAKQPQSTPKSTGSVTGDSSAEQNGSADPESSSHGG